MLGLDGMDYGGLVLLLTAGGVPWALLLAAHAGAPRARPRRDPLGRLWESFLAHAAASRCCRRRRMTGRMPSASARSALLPEAAGDIDVFAAEYARLRYGGGDAADARALAALQAKLSAIARATRARRRRRTAAAAPG